MKRLNWKVLLGSLLLLLSVLFYGLHYLLFRDAHHILIFLVGDIAFVFIEVLLVSLIIHRVLDDRERKSRLKKMNMVIGAFFSEVGLRLLDLLSGWDPHSDGVRENLEDAEKSPEQNFATLCSLLKNHAFLIDDNRADWPALKAFLMPKRDFLLRLLENPNLLEHEAFTGLLWPVFHLAEELEARDSLRGLPETDREHLCGDVTRVYSLLASQWLDYLEHLRINYPYLFSLSLRTNPFDRGATATVH
jgi:hypothetical protein